MWREASDSPPIVDPDAPEPIRGLGYCAHSADTGMFFDDRKTVPRSKSKANVIAWLNPSKYGGFWLRIVQADIFKLRKPIPKEITAFGDAVGWVLKSWGMEIMEYIMLSAGDYDEFIVLRGKRAKTDVLPFWALLSCYFDTGQGECYAGRAKTDNCFGIGHPIGLRSSGCSVRSEAAATCPKTETASAVNPLGNCISKPNRPPKGGPRSIGMI